MTEGGLALQAAVGAIGFLAVAAVFVVLAKMLAPPHRPPPERNVFLTATEQTWGVGDSWLAVRADDHERVAAALSAPDGPAPVPARLCTVFHRALEHRVTVVLPPREGWVLVIPGLDVPEALTALTASLDTEAYAFGTHEDYDLGIALARAGALIRDKHECAAEGLIRDSGDAVEGEPHELSADAVAAFANAQTVASEVDLDADVLVIEGLYGAGVKSAAT